MASALTLTGYGLVLGSLVGAWFSMIEPQPLFWPPTLAAVLAGGLGYLLACHSPEEIKLLNAPPPVVAEAAARQRLVVFAELWRRGGQRGLEQGLSGLDQPLEALAGRLLVGGAKAYEVDTALRRRAAELERQDLAPARLWESLGRGAMQCGVLVSLVQLMRAVGATAPEHAQATLAAAFAGSVYGLLLGWFVCHPQACRRRRLAAAAQQARLIWVEGLTAIADGINPNRLADRLEVTPPARPATRVSEARSHRAGRR